jgi:hypothetical protein
MKNKYIAIFMLVFTIGGGTLGATLKNIEGTWVLHWWKEAGKLENYHIIEFKICTPDYFTSCNGDYKVKAFHDGKWKSCGVGYITNVEGIGYKFDFQIWTKEFTFYYPTIENYMAGSGMVDNRPAVWWAGIPVKASLSKY